MAAQQVRAMPRAQWRGAPREYYDDSLCDSPDDSPPGYHEAYGRYNPPVSAQDLASQRYRKSPQRIRQMPPRCQDAPQPSRDEYRGLQQSWYGYHHQERPEPRDPMLQGHRTGRTADILAPQRPGFAPQYGECDPRMSRMVPGRDGARYGSQSQSQTRTHRRENRAISDQDDTDASPYWADSPRHYVRSPQIPEANSSRRSSESSQAWPISPRTGSRSSSLSRCSDTSGDSGSGAATDWTGVMTELFGLERSYLLDMAGQDSSSGIASDDHHGIHSPGNSESSPTYSSAGSQSEMSRGERQGQGPTRVVNGDFNGSDPKGKSRCGRVLDYQKPNGYHETDLDDPSSDCTFIFSPALKAKKTSHDKLTRSNSYMEATQRPTATSGRHGDHQRQTSAPSGEHHASDLVDFTPRQHRISYFDILQDNFITVIFRFLSSQELCRGARVCRRWYQLAWDPSLWTHVTLGVEDPSLDVDRALRSLTRRLSLETPGVCALVDRITLNGCKRLTDRGLLAVARRCPELRRLELQGCPLVSNIALFEVVSNCVNLEHLDVAGCAEVTCLCLTPQATLQAATYGKQIDLRYLDMTECQNLQDSGLQIIASYCTNLVHLYLRRCTQLTDIGVQYVANYCGNLREFSISDCPNVTDLALRELAKLGCNLRYLSVAKCERVTDIGVRYVARSCPKLRYLNVRGCEAITDVAMEAVARHCPRMRSLDIGKCDVTDVGLEAIAQYKLPLRKLGLKSCERVTDRGVEAVAKACKQLHLLNIQDCDVTIQVYRTVKRSCKHCLIEHTNPGFF